MACAYAEIKGTANSTSRMPMAWTRIWKFIQERLGHASVVTTMQTYTHLTNEDRKWAYDRYQERRSERAKQSAGKQP